MVERIKTFILIALVTSSLFLSSILSYSAPTYAPLMNVMNINQVATPSNQYQFDEIVIPREFISFVDGGSSVVVPKHSTFQRSLERVRDIPVSNVRTTERQDSPQEQLEADDFELALQLVFYKAMPPEYLNFIIDIDDNDIARIDGTVQRVTLFLDIEADQPRWLLEGNQIYLADANVTKGRLYDIVAGASTVTTALQLPVVEFSLETLRVKELSNSLFVDPTVVRQIQEKDQSTIYTDGSRGLRVNTRLQTIDFTDPTVENRSRELDFNEMVQEAINFLNRHQSWAGNYVLSGIDAISKANNEYKLTFKQQYQGLPINASRTLNISEITIMMKNNRVTRMNRSTLYLGQRQGETMITVLTPEQIEEVIARRMDTSQGDYDKYLAYYPIRIDGMSVQLRPAWVVTRRNMIVSFYDAETGQELRGE